MGTPRKDNTVYFTLAKITGKYMKKEQYKDEEEKMIMMMQTEDGKEEDEEEGEKEPGDKKNYALINTYCTGTKIIKLQFVRNFKHYEYIKN